MNSNTQATGEVTITSIINGKRKEVVKVTNHIVHLNEVLKSSFYSLSTSSFNIGIINTDILDSELAVTPYRFYEIDTANIVRRLTNINISRTKNIDIFSENSEQAVIEVIQRFDANGNIQDVKSVAFLTNAENIIVAITYLPTTYHQQANESLEVKYRIVFNYSNSLSDITYWKTLLSNDGKPSKYITPLPKINGMENNAYIWANVINPFNPDKNTTHLGKVLRSYGSADYNNSGTARTCGLRPFTCFESLPDYPVGNVFNHSFNSKVWYEDLNNLAEGKGAVTINNGANATFLNDFKADLGVIYINKTGELNTATYSFFNKNIGLRYTTSAVKNWGILVNQKSSIANNRPFTIPDYSSGRFLMALDKETVLLSWDKHIVIQYVDKLIIKLFKEGDYPSIASLQKFASADIVDGTLFAVNGDTVLKIENVLDPDNIILSTVDLTAFGNEQVKAITYSNTKMYIATNNAIWEGNKDGTISLLNLPCLLAILIHFMLMMKVLKGL